MKEKTRFDELISRFIEKIGIMFEQYCVHHNCNKNNDMKNITKPCSCDLSFDEKACPRETSSWNTRILSHVHSKSISSFGNEPRQFESNFDNDYESELTNGWTYHSSISSRHHCNNSKNTSRSYPAWFERTVRYLFSKQLRKCFDLA